MDQIYPILLHYEESRFSNKYKATRSSMKEMLVHLNSVCYGNGYIEGGLAWTLGLVNGCPEKGENLARRGLSTREEEIHPGGSIFKRTFLILY